MKRATLVLVAWTALVAGGVAAQAVPEGSQAARLHKSFRRTPTIGVDPFRYAFWPGWGLMLSGGGAGWNNSLNAADVGAIMYLTDSVTGRPDGLSISDMLDIIGLVPAGEGFGGMVSAEVGGYLGGPFGGKVSFGVSVMGRGYGSARVSDDAVSFFQGGNATDSVFSLGGSEGTVLATADAGGHLLINLGPVGSVDGVHVTVGVGGRYIRPVFHTRAGLGADSRFAVTGDSIAAQVVAELLQTVDPTKVDSAGNPKLAVAQGGSGMAADFLLRLAWPTSGIAFEAMVANIGSVTIEDVEQQSLMFSVATRSLAEVADSVDAAEFVRGGTGPVDITLPRIVRFSGNAWANRILQLDAAATLPVSNDDFEIPMTVELGSTWRLANSFPLRVGVILGGLQGIGYTGSVGLEARNVLFRISGASLGGLFRNATGAAVRLETGFFF